MLPQSCIIDDVYKPSVIDSDTTLKKRKHFDQQIIVTCRQSTLEGIVDEFPSEGRHPVKALIILQDSQLTGIDEVLNRLRTDVLKAVYIVDCKPKLLEKCDSLQTFALTTLVLSHTALQKLPLGIFEMKCLEKLQVDYNNLEEIPTELGYLSNLKVFTCDSQRPPLPCLPDSISRLIKLEILSFSGNQVCDISWVPTLPNLRVFRCGSNRIVHLPSQLINLRDLVWLDVSHNRLTHISGTLYHLIKGLHKFNYYNTCLRPISVRADKTALLGHLKLEQLLLSPEIGKHLERQITMVLYGEQGSGKSSLIQALKDSKGLCRMDLKHSRSHEFHQFDMTCKVTENGTLNSRRNGTPRSDTTSGSSSPDRSDMTSSFVATITFSADEMDDYIGDISADLYLLLIDLTALDHNNGSQHLVMRHLNRLQMWLQGLYELAPNTPVLLVGTHADLVRSASFNDNLSLIDTLLNKGRAYHVRRYQHGTCHHCILCSGKTIGSCHIPSPYGFDKFVDLSSNVSEKSVNGGHSSFIYECDSSKGIDQTKYPHVVGYYEIDSRRCYPNSDSKKINTCIEYLKSALLRLSVNSSRIDRIPVNWLCFNRHLSAIQAQQRTACLSIDDAVSIARSFEIAPTHVRPMLQYFNRRGILIYLSHSDSLSNIVVIESSWLYQAIDRLADGRDPWPTELNRILHRLSDREVDRQLQKSSTCGISSGMWLLQSLQHFGLFSSLTTSSLGEQFFFYHNQLQLGYPSVDVWPDMPELDERQVTCDVGVHTVRPRLFIDLLSVLNRQGRQELAIVADPAPIFLSNNIVFISYLDTGRCEECRTVKSRLKYRFQTTNSLSGDISHVADVCDEVLHKVNIRQLPHMDTIRIQVRGNSPCCILKAVISFLDEYLNDSSDDLLGDTTSDSTRHWSSSSDEQVSYFTDTLDSDHQRPIFLLCPKCVLLRSASPERILLTCMNSRQKAICGKWHSLGSWNRAITGDYRVTSVDRHALLSPSTLPDYEHPRLFMILPPSESVSLQDWYQLARTLFFEGLEVHFLCENPGYWHMNENSGVKIKPNGRQDNKALMSIFKMAVPLIQLVQGGTEQSQTSRILSSVISDLMQMYDFLSPSDSLIQPQVWLNKYKERLVTMLAKVLTNAAATFNDGLQPTDFYLKTGASVNAEDLFQTSSQANRYELGHFLGVTTSSGRFGSLRPIIIGHDVRWVCETHYAELRPIPPM